MAVALQTTLGVTEVRGLHVLLGVLTLCPITAACSCSRRRRLPAGGAPAAGSAAQ